MRERMEVNLKNVYLEEGDWAGVKEYVDAILRQQANGKLVLDIPDNTRFGVDAHFEVIIIKKETFEKLRRER